MGIESVLYRFHPAALDADDLAEQLALRGATRGDREGTFVLFDGDHWIDLELRSIDPRGTSVMMRVAVTNPVSVVPVLDALASDLIARYGGQLTAPGGRVLADQDRRAVLSADFSTRRQLFTDKFGELALPVSADEVFAKMPAAPEA